MGRMWDLILMKRTLQWGCSITSVIRDIILQRPSCYHTLYWISLLQTLMKRESVLCYFDHVERSVDQRNRGQTPVNSHKKLRPVVNSPQRTKFCQQPYNFGNSPSPESSDDTPALTLPAIDSESDISFLIKEISNVIRYQRPILASKWDYLLCFKCHLFKKI